MLLRQGEEDMGKHRPKILITGGAGYIGGNLEQYLTADWFNYDVTICDHNHNEVPLAEQLCSSDIEAFDGVVHLAALSGIIPCQENPKKAIRRNLLTAYNVFREASKYRIPVVFTSSQAAKNPETSTYAMQKRMIELMAEQMNAQGARIVVFRLTNVYGGEMYLEKKNTVVKKFIEAYTNGDPIIIDGDGHQERDFISVEDVCVFIERALANPYTDEPIDIGTGVGTSIGDLAKIFQQQSAIHQEVMASVQFSKDSRTVGVDSSIANYTTAQAVLGYRASTAKLGQYITQMIDWLKMRRLEDEDN